MHMGGISGCAALESHDAYSRTTVYTVGIHTLHSELLPRLCLCRSVRLTVTHNGRERWWFRLVALAGAPKIQEMTLLRRESKLGKVLCAENSYALSIAWCWAPIALSSPTQLANQMYVLQYLHVPTPLVRGVGVSLSLGLKPLMNLY